MTLVVERLGPESRTVPYFSALREADEQECRAAGLTAHEAVSQSIHLSTEAHCVSVDGAVMAFWGYRATSVLGVVCHAWMLTTPLADKHRVMIARTSKKALQLLHTLYPVVEVLVHEEHTLALKWLAWLGFTPHERSGLFLLLHSTRKEGFTPWAF